MFQVSIDSINFKVAINTNAYNWLEGKLVDTIGNSLPIFTLKSHQYITTDKSIQKLAYSLNIVNNRTSISNQLYAFTAYWIIQYGDVFFTAYKHSRAKHLTIRLFGLSQYDDKSKYKQEFLELLLHSLNEPLLISDIHVSIDFFSPFSDIEKIIKDFVDKHNSRYKKKLGLYYYESGLYLRPYKNDKPKCSYVLYDKQKKNKLSFEITRFEARYTKVNEFINNYVEYKNVIDSYVNDTTYKLFGQNQSCKIAA